MRKSYSQRKRGRPSKSLKPTPRKSTAELEFIDPRLLHHPPIFENGRTLPSHQTGSNAPEKQERISGERSYISEDISSESLDIQILTPQSFAVGNYVNSALEFVSNDGTLGFTISSGWSDTFFHYDQTEIQVGEQCDEPGIMSFSTGGQHDFGIYA